MNKKYIASVLLLITPLVFAPFTLSFFSTNKQTFVILMALVLLVLTAVSHLTTKKHHHQSSFFVLALGLFWAIMGLDILLTREARVEGLVGKGALLLTLPVITYLLATAKKSLKSLSWALMGLIAAGTMLALHGILQLVVLAEITTLPTWMRDISFTPAGSPLILMTTIVFTLIATITWAIKEKGLTKKTSLFTAAGIQLAALVAFSFMLAQKEIIIQLLPLRASWSLTLDALKSARELLFGIGLANFPALFTQSKPVFLTQTDLWTTIFQTASNEALQLLATVGVLGFGAFVLLIVATIKASFGLENTPLALTLRLTTYAIILSFFLLPANIITYTLFFTLAGLIAAHSSFQTKKEIALPGYASIVSAVALGTIVIVSGYFTYRVYAGEVFMRQAQLAFTANDAQGVYTAHINAVKIMPQMTDYRISFSQINLTLASSLSQSQSVNTETGKAPELTDQQREQISSLIQRAIEQGQIAAQLRPNLYSTWQNLGGIYRNLINIAQGAEDFAIQYLGQAIAKDPANPLLRVEYGGLFYQLSQLVEDKETQVNLLDQAIQQFQTAVRLRPNYANGQYNLANALDKKGSYRLAYQAMTQVLANIEPDSDDYERAQQELLLLEQKLPKTPQQQAGSQAQEQPGQYDLQQPAPLPKPLPGGPIELPQESQQLEPTPQPTE
ncbi:tetratricopeptide repeat protein [Patescibacteria group bacterium]|nr:tetratricopeptide repeat protein [Patescibacteria group bacterium]